MNTTRNNKLKVELDMFQLINNNQPFILKKGDIIYGIHNIFRTSQEFNSEGEIVFISSGECHVWSKVTNKVYIFDSKDYGKIFDSIRRPTHYPKTEIDLIKSNGFKLIGVSMLYLENTFIFESDEEANNAFNFFEKENNLIQGWWYDRNSFLSIKQEYENKMKANINVFWL